MDSILGPAFKSPEKLRRKTIATCLSFVALFAAVRTSAQNNRVFYYIIRKADVESGKIPIIYHDEHDSVRPIRMCYASMRAEGLTMDNGVPVFHFEPIRSSEFDSVDGCISNNTPLGKFEIDIRKKKIGNPNKVIRIPFRSLNWNASLMLYKVRFSQNGEPPLAVGDPASMLVSVVYGYTFGYAKIRHEEITHYYITIGPLAGITSAALNSTTVKTQFIARDQSNVAFSYGISSIFGRNNFGVTASFGFDVNVGPNAGLWIYQNKPWVAIGVSSSLGMF